jgi:hypothetical protein
MTQYIFYNPTTLKIMGASDDPHAMQFPYIESKETFHSFNNLYIENGKIKFKELTLQGKDVSIIKKREIVYDKLLDRLEKGEIDDKMALKTLLKHLKN